MTLISKAELLLPVFLSLSSAFHSLFILIVFFMLPHQYCSSPNFPHQDHLLCPSILVMDSAWLPNYSKSLFDETHSTMVACQVYGILREHVDWNMAHRRPDYLDVVKVKYRTFLIEYSSNEAIGKLPSMFTKEFGFEMYKYNQLVDRYGNLFEVVAEKRDGAIYFTHGWSDIHSCYVDAECRGCWASITYIRPKLFVLILQDRYYRDCIVKNIYPPVCLNLSRSVFGPDENPGWGGRVPLPYYHDNENFTHSFVVILTETDVTSGFLTINYGNAASKVLSKHAKNIKLVDERGLEWNCTVQNISEPYNHVKIGGEWGDMVKVRNYGGGSHLMFGSPKVGNTFELFVKKRF